MSAYYRIQHDSEATRDFAWAMQCGPVGDMPFLNPTYARIYAESQRVDPLRPGIYVEDGFGTAKDWPDFMGYGGGEPAYFVSERVLTSLDTSDIPYARLTEMPIAEINCRHLRRKNAPRYFVLEADSGMEIDYVATGMPVDGNGRPIVNPPPNPWPKIWRFRLSTWTGADLFGWPNIWNRPSCSLLCTDRIVDLSKQDGWTNVRFSEIEIVK